AIPRFSCSGDETGAYGIGRSRQKTGFRCIQNPVFHFDNDPRPKSQRYPPGRFRMRGDFS
ncbi:hypothetical protein, partial [Pseudomonas aeruginosa]|uniref:hypothetical protein n=1 Tax=Pseudomonas aeruginosa TaxID=287 RepID=UPI002F41AD36